MKEEPDDKIDYVKEYQLSIPHSNITGKSIRIPRVPLVQSSVNLANSVIGIGNLGFPYLFKMFGVCLTVGFFMVAYWLMYMSCQLLLEARNWSKKQDFSKISVYCFGKLGLISHFAIWLNNFAMCLAFLVVYGNGLDTVFE